MHLFDARLEYQYAPDSKTKKLCFLWSISGCNWKASQHFYYQGIGKKLWQALGALLGSRMKTQSSLTPQEKAGVISTLQGEGHRVAMVTCFNSSSMRCCGQHKNPVICDCIGTSR
jgi:hypothetical protein